LKSCITVLIKKSEKFLISKLFSNYFDCFGENLATALSLPVHTLHLDLVRCPLQLDDILESNLLSNSTSLSLGLSMEKSGKMISKISYFNQLLMLWEPTVFL
jgi:5-methyltetrahydropteroyltriglutamate--homocysteine methyltransferase